MENKTTTLIVGAGPAGLACAIRLKRQLPSHEVVVIDKAENPGGHNLSGAVLETASIEALLDDCCPGWRENETGKELLGRRVKDDRVLFCAGAKMAFDVSPLVATSKALGLKIGQMSHRGDAIVSISMLTKWMTRLALEKGVEVIHGFAAKELLWDNAADRAAGVILADQGLEADGSKLPGFLTGETILADTIALAEGCDGLLTEQFIKKAGLERKHPQLFSIGVKEIIRVSPEQYAAFGGNRVVHAMGYPLWAPFIGPSLFGGGILYAMGDDRIAVGMIVALDWKYADFNPQNALTAFKNHGFVNPFLANGKVVEAGARMIPEGGWRALPRDKRGNLGHSNVLLLGDGAGLVNMIKIKGLHNAISSGSLAGTAIAETAGKPSDAALSYSDKLKNSPIEKEMRGASKFRQLVAKLGPTLGFPLSIVSDLLPDFSVEEDYHSMKPSAPPCPVKPAGVFDKMTFTALAGTRHREGQPSHLSILDRTVCDKKCRPVYAAPCVVFCPAGVYEDIRGEIRPANPSNCLHCKTCQRKCPFDNIRWTVPEGGGGPRYSGM
jgi:electron-transferring-flavoprotein dehydrogenase